MRTFVCYFAYASYVLLGTWQQNFGIPISNLISNEHGNYRTMRLSYKKWGTVKEEIENMGESILVNGLALRMNGIMNTVYLFVMKFYVEGIMESIERFD